jgi:hypothetical protein
VNAAVRYDMVVVVVVTVVVVVVVVVLAERRLRERGPSRSADRFYVRRISRTTAQQTFGFTRNKDTRLSKKDEFLLLE